MTRYEIRTRVGTVVHIFDNRHRAIQYRAERERVVGVSMQLYEVTIIETPISGDVN